MRAVAQVMGTGKQGRAKHNTNNPDQDPSYFTSPDRVFPGFCCLDFPLPNIDSWHLLQILSFDLDGVFHEWLRD
jgi:hypothetical protein